MTASMSAVCDHRKTWGAVRVCADHCCTYACGARPNGCPGMQNPDTHALTCCPFCVPVAPQCNANPLKPCRKTVPFLLDYHTNQTIQYVHQNFVNWTYGGGLPSTQTMQTNPCVPLTFALVSRTTRRQQRKRHGAGR